MIRCYTFFFGVMPNFT